jgi:hypothetical protein
MVEETETVGQVHLEDRQAWSGTCRELVLKFIDGSVLHVRFAFTSL